MQTFLRTDLGTFSTQNALHSIDFPGFLLFVDIERPNNTMVLALATERTAFSIYRYSSSDFIRSLGRFIIGLPNRFLIKLPFILKKLIISTYHSTLFLHGSIVSDVSGLSIGSLAFIARTYAKRFVSVGMLTRNFLI